MSTRERWTREQLLVAFDLYCKIPFGKMHAHNPEIIQYSTLIGRTPSALAMKLSNIASLDPAITSTGRKGLLKASQADRLMWEEMTNDWESFAIAFEKICLICRVKEIWKTTTNRNHYLIMLVKIGKFKLQAE